MGNHEKMQPLVTFTSGNAPVGQPQFRPPDLLLVVPLDGDRIHWFLKAPEAVIACAWQTLQCERGRYQAPFSFDLLQGTEQRPPQASAFFDFAVTNESKFFTILCRYRRGMRLLASASKALLQRSI